MVHAAKSEELLAFGKPRAPTGYRQAPLEAVDTWAGAGWFPAQPDAFTVHEVKR
jgi:hypothetical protein